MARRFPKYVNLDTLGPYQAVLKALCKRDFELELNRATTPSARKQLIINIVRKFSRGLRKSISNIARLDRRMDEPYFLVRNWFNNLANRVDGNRARAWKQSSVNMVQDHRRCASVFVFFLGAELFYQDPT